MPPTQHSLPAAFAAAMVGLEPFEPRPALAVAVSGGADSLALAVLTRDWAHQRNGSTLALVVDHGLRLSSADEARLTIERLAGLGIPGRLLPLSDLKHGSALAERARIMRYETLMNACREAGILHLLLGHHAADQIETLAMRVLRDSHNHGIACMSAVIETACPRLLRPLLGIQPARLRTFLTKTGTEWIEDPSNQDMRATRARLRHGLGANPSRDAALLNAIATVARLRAQEEAETAAELALRVTIRPEGFALLSPGRIGTAALGSLIQTIGGAPYPPALAQITGLAAQPRPATAAGVRMMPAGRLGNGLLIVREEAAVMDPIAARPDTTWDNRFRLMVHPDVPDTATIGKLGDDATHFRDTSDLPAVVLRTLPALRVGNFLAAVPHLGYLGKGSDTRITVLFAPPRQLAGSSFVPAP